MDREEYEARMARQRRQLEDLDVARGEALFAAIQQAMQLYAANRDSRRDEGWRDAMLALAEASDAATLHVLNETGVVRQRDLD